MASIRRLERPPITEALVDLRAAPRRPLDAAALRRLKEIVGDRFPKVTQRNALGLEVDVRGAIPTVDRKVNGLRGFFFESADGRDIAQFRVDGFTYNRLKPYEGGDQLVERALELWSTYVSVADPQGVARIAMRYINHVQLPPEGDFDEYLTAAPPPPQGLAGAIGSFLSRVTVIDTPTSRQAIVTQSAEPAPDGKAYRLLIDVDAAQVSSSDIGLRTERESVRDSLLMLRETKNTAFFGAVTEKTLELFS